MTRKRLKAALSDVTARWPEEARRHVLQRDTLDALLSFPGEATLADFVEAWSPYGGMAEAMAIPPDEAAALYAEVYGTDRQEAS